MESTNFVHQQHHLGDQFTGCSSTFADTQFAYGVSSSLLHHQLKSSGLATNATSGFHDAIGEGEHGSSFSTTIVPLLANDEAKNFDNCQQRNYNLPKIEEDSMLSLFPDNFGSLLVHNPITTTSMETSHYYGSIDSWTANGCAHHKVALLNQMGLIVSSSSSPNSPSSISRSSPAHSRINLLPDNYADFSLMNNDVSFSKMFGAKKKTTSNNAVLTNKKSSSQLKVTSPSFKASAKKVSEKVAALHPLVSPFGKTDQASVLRETFRCIQFLQDKIHSLCRQPVHNKSCITFSMGLRSDGNGDEEEEASKDLHRRGLCLVPLSWTSYLSPTQLDVPASNHAFYF